MDQLIAAIDQGTTSSRTILFDRDGPIACAQLEHRQIFPQPGWVEHDPLEVWERVSETIRKVRRPGIAAIGITNQRETTVVWNRFTGKPYCNAIVWQDTRTRGICEELANSGTEVPHAGGGNQDRFRAQCGLPLATYFSGPKIRWILEHVPVVAEAARNGDAIFGTMDSWVVWNLTGQHVTDVTNASRTMLMNLATLDWDEDLLRIMGILRTMLPRIVSSNDPNGFGMARADGPFGAEIPVTGILGDQHAAIVGHACFEPGEMKNTYGTGCFMLLNTGPRIVQSKHGLLTTLAYQFHNQPPVYALEGSVAIAGALVQWVRDNLGIIGNSSDIDALASQVPDNGGVYFVPAFSGLFAPWWRSDARGLIMGLSRQSNKSHLARAVLEAAAYQTLDVLEAMRAEAGIDLKALRVDGGMTASEILMQFQADIANVPVERAAIAETTALGAAFAAGLAIGFWKDQNELRERRKIDRRWEPKMAEVERTRLHAKWLDAVKRTMGWI